MAQAISILSMQLMDPSSMSSGPSSLSVFARANDFETLGTACAERSSVAVHGLNERLAFVATWVEGKTVGALVTPHGQAPKLVTLTGLKAYIQGFDIIPIPTSER